VTTEIPAGIGGVGDRGRIGVRVVVGIGIGGERDPRRIYGVGTPVGGGSRERVGGVVRKAGLALRSVFRGVGGLVPELRIISGGGGGGALAVLETLAGGRVLGIARVGREGFVCVREDGLMGAGKVGRTWVDLDVMTTNVSGVVSSSGGGLGVIRVIRNDTVVVVVEELVVARSGLLRVHDDDDDYIILWFAFRVFWFLKFFKFFFFFFY
jgi:hypothetical protein